MWHICKFCYMWHICKLCYMWHICMLCACDISASCVTCDMSASCVTCDISASCVTCDICKLKETSSAPLLRIVIRTGLHRTIVRGLPFLAGWNSCDRYAICHHAKQWDHFKKLTCLWSRLQLLLSIYLPVISLRPAIRRCAFCLVEKHWQFEIQDKRREWSCSRCDQVDGHLWSREWGSGLVDMTSCLLLS
jgi:hypothetical protein